MPKTIPPQRILVIPLRYIGDTILTVPLVRNLRAHFPDAQINMLVSKTTASLMEPCPYLNQVLVEPKSSAERLKLIKGYDTVFLLRKSVSMALICKLAGVKTLVGYDKQRFPFGYKRWGWFLDKSARYPSLRTETPQAVSHLGLLQAAGIPASDSHLELWTTEVDRTRVDTLLQEAGISEGQPLAVLHAASASHGKQIDLAKFADSLRHLHHQGYALLATGTDSDVESYRQLKQQTGLPLIILAGKTSLRETVALYQRIQLLLTVDSSPIHMGAAVRAPKIVGVFGPTNERQWGPHLPNASAERAFKPVFMELPCRPCYAKVCEHNNCKELLTGDQIAMAVIDCIHSGTPSNPA